MPPKSDESNGIEVANSNEKNDDAGKTKLPFKQRMTNFITNGIKFLRIFIYDKEHQSFFGNTPSSWIKIAIYYFIFYVCLGLFYSGMVAVFGAIVSRASPTYTYQNNQMNEGGQVYIGMGFRPMPVIDDVSLTVYNDTASQNGTVSSLENYRIEFLTQYDTAYVQECSPTEPASKLQGIRSCEFTWTDIVTSETHPCSDTNMYGWPAGQPCVLVKLNKIYGWTPAAGSVIDKVVNATGQPVLAVDQRDENIYITCNGKNAGDQSVLGSMIFYSILHPSGNPNYGGIPYYFFPYLNSPEHVQAFVLVQFTSLPLERTVNIQCRAWAPNIQQQSQGTNSRGMVTFSLYRSNKPAPVKN